MFTAFAVFADMTAVTRTGDNRRVSSTFADAPRLIRPMLATTGPLPPPPGDAGDWAHELKWDGVRAVAYLHDGHLRLLSRTDQDMTSRYPELAPLATAVPGRLVLDGEIVTLLDGRPSFSQLQQRMQIRHSTPDLVAAVPVAYLIFDVLHHDDRSLLTTPYADRRRLVEQLGLTGPTWQTPPAWFGAGADVLAASREQGLEGVVSKRLTSTYRPGTRSRDWIKTKNIRMQTIVIGGWTAGQGRRAGGVGSLLLGIPDPPGNAELHSGRGLRYVGHVGTGFTTAMLTDLSRRLAALAQTGSPFTAAGGTVPREHARGARWVTPTLVGEVAYVEWTPERILRHPSWRGYRPDRPARQVVLD